jgi:hypothetical protein
MGNLSSNLNQNIQEFANNLIEEERSKNNSLNHSRTNFSISFLQVNMKRTSTLKIQRQHLSD